MARHEDGNTLDLNSRIRRSKGRPGRKGVASARVTEEEQMELENAAKGEGKALSEWAREVLLREARGKHTELATFTEVVAIRLLLNAVLQPRQAPLTPAEFDRIVTDIRSDKHTGARELLNQYTNPLGDKK